MSEAYALDRRELATILAALRVARRAPCRIAFLHAIAGDAGPALDAGEIDALVERLNVGR